MKVNQVWQQFLQFVMQDNSLQESLKDATDRNAFVQKAVEQGKEKGFNFTAKELEAAIAETMSPVFEYLSDDQLELVVGGVNENGARNRAISDAKLLEVTGGHVGGVALSFSACGYCEYTY